MNNNQKWMKKYELLKEYQKEHGNIDVPTNYEKDGIKLGQWLATQRQAHKGQGKCTITPDQTKLLEELGINWQVYNNRWNYYYEQLKEYKKQHGNIDVPKSYEQNGMELGKWLMRQRRAYHGHKRYKITENQIQLLEELGMNWQVHDKKWNDYYELLKEYKEEYGNIDVPQAYEKDGMKLGTWLSTQRQTYQGKTQCKMTDTHIQLLEELGMNWQLYDKRWNEYYELLKAYKEEYGNINIPVLYETKGKKLGSWLHNQRKSYYGKGTYRITQERIKLLEELDTNWNMYEKTWNECYELLKEYQEEHGNIDMPTDYVKDGVKLGSWLARQRYVYKGNAKEKLTENQVKLLEQLGMNWNLHDKKWNEYYELLKEYQEEHGNIDVPQFYEKDGKKLYNWLHHQRQAYKGQGNCRITQNQIKLLNELEIDWSSSDTRVLNQDIVEENKEKYYQILVNRINHIMDDLIMEDIDEINEGNQKEIEKVMIKRIWK